MAKAELQKAPVPDILASGVVLTGGGACLPGAADLAERILDLPVRTGRPSALMGMTDLAMEPSDAAAAGLVLNASDTVPVRRARSEGVLRRMTAKIGQVLSEFI
jgi:cell division protein FtsA